MVRVSGLGEGDLPINWQAEKAQAVGKAAMLGVAAQALELKKVQLGGSRGRLDELNRKWFELEEKLRGALSECKPCRSQGS